MIAPPPPDTALARLLGMRGVLVQEPQNYTSSS